MTRRVLLGMAALMMIVGLAPTPSQASCYPVPDAFCPPGAIKISQRIPLLPRLSNFPGGFPTQPDQVINPLIATVNQQIDGVNSIITETNNAIAQLPGIQNPVYAVWPEANVVIANVGTPQPFPPAANARQTGKVYFHNLDTQYHILQEAGCANGGSCRFKDLLLVPGGVLTSGRFIEVKKDLYKDRVPKPEAVVSYMCRLHPELKGTFAVN